MSKAGIFLDRDGVLNYNTHYAHLVEDLYLTPTLEETFSLLLNFPQLEVVVVTNQSGVGRGYFNIANVLSFEAELRKRIYDASSYYLPPHKWYHCYSEDDAHLWRKPNIGMITEATNKNKIDLSRSAMFVDSWQDMKTAENAGIAFYPIDPYKGPFLLSQVESFLNGFNKDAELPTIH